MRWLSAGGPGGIPPRGQPRDEDAGKQLADALEEHTADFRTRVTADLTLIDTLLNLGDEEMAAAALDEQRRALRAYITSIERAVARASAEQEAGQVIDLTERLRRREIDVTDSSEVVTDSPEAGPDSRDTGTQPVERLEPSGGPLRSAAVLVRRLLRLVAALGLLAAMVPLRLASRRSGSLIG